MKAASDSPSDLLGGDCPLVSVVICTAHGNGLAKCLGSVLANDYANFEVIVVDNRPAGPGAQLVVKAIAQQGLVRVVPEWRRGLSYARNSGMKAARGAVVAFTDDDARVASNWITVVVDTFGHDPLAAAVTGPVLAAELDTPAQQLFEAHGNFPKDPKRRTFELRSAPSDVGEFYPFNTVAMGVGANFALRRTLLPPGFCFDVSLGAGSPARGGEDMDCFVSLLYDGRRIVYEPRLVVWHSHRRSHHDLRRLMFSYGIGNAAFLSKQLVQPGRRGDLLRRIWAGAGHAKRSRLVGSDWPRDLVVVELAGLMLGPACYLTSRLRTVLAGLPGPAVGRIGRATRSRMPRSRGYRDPGPGRDMGR